MEMDGRCRICLGQAESSVDIFVNFLGENKSYTYAESIRHIAKVEVQLDDGLPQTVCYECCAELENIFKFGLLIRHGDEILRKQLAETLQPLSNDGNIRELGVGEEFMQTEDVDMQMCVLEDDEETIVEDYVGVSKYY